MKLTGSYQIKLEKQKVWEALNNPEILKKAIPGCEEFIKKSDTEFTATAKNKIGPFNASFTGDIELKDINAPNSYKISGSGNSPVGFASGEADVKLEDIKNPEKDEDRAKNPEWLVMLGVCTHLGCVPLGDKGEYKGWFCPCHGSHYDTSGRIRKGPAPTNLEIPKYEFVDNDTIKIG